MDADAEPTRIYLRCIFVAQCFTFGQKMVAIYWILKCINRDEFLEEVGKLTLGSIVQK